MGHINWADVVGTVFPLVVILGGGWLKTHSKVTETLDLIRKTIDETDNAAHPEAPAPAPAPDVKNG